MGSLGSSVVVADEAQDCVPYLAKRQVPVVFLLMCRVVAGVGGEGELEVGAQDIDAGLPQAVVGGIVGKAGQSVDAAEPDGRGVRAELVDGLGEALSVEPGGFPVGASLINTLAAIGHDQGDKRASPGDHPERELHQVEERLGVQLGGAVDFLKIKQIHQAIEDAARHKDRGEESDG
ncbi:hypothetical protein ACN6K8_001554 [[Kitasatospora] papulosa]|uniref:hypothetical protein n=1 Tax=[Kitasatospora] papulosa TaxID=1464011 RepID=UPI00403D2AC7